MTRKQTHRHTHKKKKKGKIAKLLKYFKSEIVVILCVENIKVISVPVHTQVFSSERPQLSVWAMCL